jgi:hypothetical protein
VLSEWPELIFSPEFRLEVMQLHLIAPSSMHLPRPTNKLLDHGLFLDASI